MVFLKQRVPFAAPDHLDDVPARAAERRLKLLNNLTVAAYRPVEALKIAVDHKNQIVELLAGSQRDRAERFGLVGLAIAQKAQTFELEGFFSPRSSR